MKDLFNEIIGHDRVVELLETELNSPAQAYLLVGPQGVGKATVARKFAAALLGDDERTRRLALAGTHPDLTILEPEGATSLGVDQARDVVTRASMSPVEADRTVFLFPDAGSMTDSAANALLKTLEEPTSSVVFILVAESEDDFPPTVSSRCRTFHMGRVPQSEIVPALMKLGLSETDATGVAVVSGGRPGLALALMSQPEVAAFRDLWLAIPQEVTPHPGDGQHLAARVLEELAPLVEDAMPGDLTKEKAQRARRRVEMSLLITGLEILASWYSDSASLQMGGPVRNRDVDLALLTDVPPRKAVQSAESVMDAVVDIQLNLRREMVLANLFASLGSDV